MISHILGAVVTRQVPQHLLGGYANGQYQVFGSILKNVATGRIVGHLQETTGLASLLTSLAPPPIGPALQVGQLALQAGQLVQGELMRRSLARIEAGIETLQKLGVADLAFSAAGLGVSVVGFAVMSAKIDGLKRAISDVADQIEILSAKIDQLQQDAIDLDLADIRGLAKSFDEGWQLSDAAAQVRWHDVARAALSFQSRFELRAERALAGEVSRYPVAEPLLDALGLIGALRVTSLMACNEAEAARAAAADNARAIERITGAIGLADFARIERTQLDPKPGSHQWMVASAKANQAVRPTIRKMRHREAAAVTRAAPLDEIARLGVSPRDWLAIAREENDAPLIFLPSAG